MSYATRSKPTARASSSHEYGQIYVPEVNKALMIGTLLIVLGFQSSSALGAAYGIAVTGTRSVTTLLFAVLARTRWRWPMWRVLSLTGFFLVFDLAFLGANVLKIERGGWVPLLIAAVILTLMMTWERGREIVRGIMRQSGLPRLHSQVVLLSIVGIEAPNIDETARVRVTPLRHGFFRVVARYGFMESPDVPAVLALCESRGLHTKPMETSYYLGRERLLPTGVAPMARWRKKLFVFMSRNAQSAAQFFGLPPNRVIELGAQIEL